MDCYHILCLESYVCVGREVSSVLYARLRVSEVSHRGATTTGQALVWMFGFRGAALMSFLPAIMVVPVLREATAFNQRAGMLLKSIRLCLLWSTYFWSLAFYVS